MPRTTPLAYDGHLASLLADATAGLHRLAGSARLLPSAGLIGEAAVRCTALAVTALAGDPVTSLDLLRVEAGRADDARPDGAPVGAAHRALDVAEALRTGLSLLGRGAPLDARLLVAVRDRLEVVGGAGTAGASGWNAGRSGGGSAGDAVPSRFERLERLLGDASQPMLVRVALAQHRLSTRGARSLSAVRLGPLVATLALAGPGVLAAPLLRLPVQFAIHPDAYASVLATPAPGAWVRFFLDAVRAQAAEDERWALRIAEIQLATRRRLEGQRASRTVLAAADHLVARPYLTAAALAVDLDVSLPTARAAIAQLVDQGDLVEQTRRRRDRYYVAPKVVELVHGASMPAGASAGPRAPITGGRAPG